MLFLSSLGALIAGGREGGWWWHTGKFSLKWLGSYAVENIFKKVLFIRHKKSVVELSKKYNVAPLKPYLDSVDPADNKNKDVPLDEKPPKLQGADPHNLDPQNLEGVLQKVSNSLVYRHVDAQTDISLSAWSKLPDEIAEKILVLCVQSSDGAIYVHLQFSGEDLKKVGKYNGNIKVRVRKIVKCCGASLFISKFIKGKKWKFA